MGSSAANEILLSKMKRRMMLVKVVALMMRWQSLRNLSRETQINTEAPNMSCVLGLRKRFLLVLWAEDEEGTGLWHWHHCLLQLEVCHWTRPRAEGNLWLLLLIIT